MSSITKIAGSEVDLSGLIQAAAREIRGSGEVVAEVELEVHHDEAERDARLTLVVRSAVKHYTC